MKNILKKIRPIILLFPLMVVFPITSCSSSASNNNLYQKNYNIDSVQSYLLSQMTVSIETEYLSEGIPYSQSGTGWVYKIDEATNSWYFATNAHVANVLTFENKTITSYPSSGFKTTKYDSCTSYSLRFVPSSNISETNNKLVDSSNLNVIYVERPEIVYTTLWDEQYNNLFKDLKMYVDLDGNKTLLKGMSDIAILKYNLPTNPNYYLGLTSLKYRNENVNFVNNFVEWLTNCKLNIFNNKIQILKTPENINFEEKKYGLSFYMGGFPRQGGQFRWKSFSDFLLNESITKKFQYSWEMFATGSSGNDPITFFNANVSDVNDPTTYNYASSGVHGYFYADAQPGSSGSPIAVDVGGKIYIVGIYWGTAIFSVDGEIKNLGVCDFFWSNKQGYQYNLISNIDSAIEKKVV